MSLVNKQEKTFFSPHFGRTWPIPLTPNSVLSSTVQIPIASLSSMGEQEPVEKLLETIKEEIVRSLTLSSLRGFEALELLRSTPLKLEEVIRLYPFIAKVLSESITVFKDPFVYSFFVDVIYQVGLSYRIASIQVECDEEGVRKFAIVITDCTLEDWRRANDLLAEMTRAALKRFGERVREVYRMVTIECADAYSSEA